MISAIPTADPFQPGPTGFRWHGTHAASSAFAVPDNVIGAAGPAGPVARPTLVYVHLDQFSVMAGITRALFADNKIISMSFSNRTHWALAWTQLPLIGFTAFVRATHDVLLFAAAGNDGENVDATTCFPLAGCWEKYLHAPCENPGIICVGGLDINSRDRDARSNFGSESVDIFGPFHLLVGADPDHPEQFVAREIRGTSASAPFVAGVTALIWAATPGFNADTVEVILRRNMAQSPDDEVGRRVVHRPTNLPAHRPTMALGA